MNATEWGSCSSCGGDRELTSLDADGRCECCPAPKRMSQEDMAKIVDLFDALKQSLENAKKGDTK